MKSRVNERYKTMQVHKVGGRDVVDAIENIEIEITDQDIKLAARKDPANCVMARACMKQRGTDALVHISRVYLKMSDKNIWVRYMVDNSLRTEIVAFDRGGEFAPGTYKLRRPEPSKLLGKQNGSNQRPETIKTKRAVPKVLSGVRASYPKGKGCGMVSLYKG